jgi:glycosyltransferase involved in cell wall biosynthesis
MNDITSISVILPVYNDVEYVDVAIRSILDQTFGDFELLVIDDASTDGSSERIDEFDDERIVHVENDSNVGLIRSLNQGLDLANGRYIARQDADDVSSKTRLERQYHYLEQNPNIDLLGTAATLIDENGEPFDSFEPHESPSLDDMKMMNQFIHGSICARAEVIRKVGGYNHTFRYCEDYELWLRMMQKGSARNIPQVLYKKRDHPSNITTQNTQETALNFALSQQSVFEECGVSPEWSSHERYRQLLPRYRALYHRRYGDELVRRAEYAAARKEYHMALRENPIDWPALPRLLLLTLPAGIRDRVIDWYRE